MFIDNVVDKRAFRQKIRIALHKILKGEIKDE